MVLADSHGISRVPRYRYLPNEPEDCRLPDCHRLWWAFPDPSTNRLVCDSSALRPNRPYNPAVHARRFGLFRVRSPLLAESLLFSLPVGTEMVHFPTLPSPAYGFSGGCSSISQSGFPHSDIPGSKRVCRSPRLIAAYRVLHRLPAPRHSPYTLSSLTVIKCVELTSPAGFTRVPPGPALQLPPSTPDADPDVSSFLATLRVYASPHRA